MTLAQKFNITELVDSHAHLAYLSSDEELTQVVENAKETGLEAIFNMGIDLKSSKIAVEQSKKSKGYLKAFVGIDPEVFEPGSSLFVGLENHESFIDLNINDLRGLIQENKDEIVGIGETGMDYYHIEKAGLITKVREESKRIQQILFRRHLELAQEFTLPLSIHSRWAENECMDVVEEYDAQGIFHSYTADYETAKRILDNGWGLGVNGIATFKKAETSREVYKKLLGKISMDWTPLDFYNKGIFFETDAPFLAPEGKRGEPNEPANTKIIFESFINFLKQ